MIGGPTLKGTIKALIGLDWGLNGDRLAHLEGNGSQQAVEGALPVSGDDDHLIAHQVCVAHLALEQGAHALDPEP